MRIAIILTTIERPKALKKSVQSILDNWQENWVLLIADQNPVNSESYQIIDKFICENPDKDIRILQLEYNCGISFARNELIHFAHLIGCEYTLLTADSILFNDSMNDLPFIIQQMEKQGYSRCGFNLLNRIPWEAELTLVPNESFQLTFINPKDKEKQLFVPCDIVRNFHLSATESMINVGYDEELLMCEHESEAWKYKQAGYKVCCTNFINGTYDKPENTPKYDEIRIVNFYNGQKTLKKKYNLKTWITYANEIPKM